MSTFRRENLDHIKNIFQEKTGVELTHRRSVGRTVRVIAVVAAVIACCTITALAAASLFSSLDGSSRSRWKTDLTRCFNSRRP